ncbi:MAG: hypothetical protein ACK5PQ_04490 [Alphaproteobacteria bacterium]
MIYKTLRRILNLSMVFFLLIGFISLFLCIGAASVSNYFGSTLHEVRQIEEKGLLSAPPVNVSPAAQDTISFLGNSESIEKYVLSVNQSFNHTSFAFMGSLSLFLLCLTLRIWFRKRKFPNEEKVIFSFKHR